MTKTDGDPHLEYSILRALHLFRISNFVLRICRMSRRPYRLFLSGRSYDRQKAVRFEAGPADERPVDVGLGQQAGRVLGVDAAAVLNSDSRRNPEL